MDIDDRLDDLQVQLSDLQGELRTLRLLVRTDHSSALNKIRYVTEMLLHDLCSKNEVSWGSAEPTLERMIGPLVTKGVLPRNVAIHVRTVQTNASPGSHFQSSGLSGAHVAVAQLALLEFLEWYASQSPREREVDVSSANEMPPVTSTSSPDVLGQDGKRSVTRARHWLGFAAIVGLAGLVAVVLWAWSGPTPTPPTPEDSLERPTSIEEPAAGLAAFAAYHDGHIRFSADDWSAAASDFRRVEGQPHAPPSWRALHLAALAQAALSRDDVDTALESARGAAEADESSAVAHVVLAEVLRQAGRLDDALASARVARRLEPDWWRPRAALARTFATARSFDEAIVEFRSALSIHDEPALHAELALAFNGAGLVDQARAAAELALAADDELALAHLTLADLGLLGQDIDAVSHGGRAVALEPRSSVAWAIYAAALLQAGRADEGCIALARAFRDGDVALRVGLPEGRVNDLEAASQTCRSPLASQRRRARVGVPRPGSGAGGSDDPLAGLDL